MVDEEVQAWHSGFQQSEDVLVLTWVYPRRGKRVLRNLRVLEKTTDNMYRDRVFVKGALLYTLVPSDFQVHTLNTLLHLDWTDITRIHASDLKFSRNATFSSSIDQPRKDGRMQFKMTWNNGASDVTVSTQLDEPYYISARDLGWLKGINRDGPYLIFLGLWVFCGDHNSVKGSAGNIFFVPMHRAAELIEKLYGEACHVFLDFRDHIQQTLDSVAETSQLIERYTCCSIPDSTWLDGTFLPNPDG